MDRFRAVMQAVILWEWSVHRGFEQVKKKDLKTPWSCHISDNDGIFWKFEALTTRTSMANETRTDSRLLFVNDLFKFQLALKLLDEIISYTIHTNNTNLND